MNNKDLINKIENYQKKNRLTKMEEKRFLMDLQNVYERLHKKEYQKFSYSLNKFDVPSRTRDIYTELNFYCHLGKTWAAILEQLQINNYQQIVDLCPGFSPKIELALFYLNFKNEVIVIDKNIQALTQLTNFMKLFNPQFKITKKQKNIFKKTNKKYNLVLANHIIDDLVVYYFADKNKIDLNTVYEKEKLFTDLWKLVLKNKEDNIKEIAPIIVEALNSRVNKGGYLCLSNYKSYMEKILDQKKATKFNRELFKKIILQLKERGFTEEKEVIKRGLQKYNGHFGIDDCIVLKSL